MNREDSINETPSTDDRLRELEERVKALEERAHTSSYAEFNPFIGPGINHEVVSLEDQERFRKEIEAAWEQSSKDRPLLIRSIEAEVRDIEADLIEPQLEGTHV